MLSKKTKYAIAALRVLANQSNGLPMLISDIAKVGEIPKKFLELILLELKKNHILDSKKGQGGGYFLKLAPDQISLGQVIRQMSGPLGLVSCVNKEGYMPCDECPGEDLCGIRQIMTDVLSATCDILDHETLADLLVREEKLKQAKRDYMFHI
ncbi:Rrf2 family transcriptional regulator [bacterium]|nr:Rrf2 family transcriptional regulator [bacterium]